MYFTGQPGFGGDEPKEQQVEPGTPKKKLTKK